MRQQRAFCLTKVLLSILQMTTIELLYAVQRIWVGSPPRDCCLIVMRLIISRTSMDGRHFTAQQIMATKRLLLCLQTFAEALRKIATHEAVKLEVSLVDQLPQNGTMRLNK